MEKLTGNILKATKKVKYALQVVLGGKNLYLDSHVALKALKVKAYFQPISIYN